METITICGKKINLEKTYGKKNVGQYINDLKPNIELININAYSKGKKAFSSEEELERWLKANQGYNKEIKELVMYFSYLL